MLKEHRVLNDTSSWGLLSCFALFVSVKKSHTCGSGFHGNCDLNVGQMEVYICYDDCGDLVLGEVSEQAGSGGVVVGRCSGLSHLKQESWR